MTPKRLFKTLFQEVPTLETVSTGGGCTGLFLLLDVDGSHLLVTHDASAPDASNTEPQDLVTVGLYDRDGAQLNYTEVPALHIAATLNIIQAAYNMAGIKGFRKS